MVLAEDEQGVQLESPIEIHVEVADVNDNAPVCIKDKAVFEVQENQEIGTLYTHTHAEMLVLYTEKTYFILSRSDAFLDSYVGDVLAHDADKENTQNSLLTYKLLSQTPTNPSDGMFFIDQARGSIQVAKHNFHRKDVPQYQLKVSVTDGGEVMVLLW